LPASMLLAGILLVFQPAALSPSSDALSAAHSSSTPTSTPRPTRTPRPTPSPTPARISAGIEVNVAVSPTPFSPRMLGSNLPAWLKREVFENETFRRRVAASGIRLLRIPGGAWADEYGWLSCETGQDQPGAFPCRFPWASRPSDFINFFKAVAALGNPIEPMYIVNVNYTAQEAAALVAFHNSYVTDTTPIGVDIRGTNWYTAGRWAQLRAAAGNLQPLRINLWEIGNELYGGKPAVKGCPKSGWENTWTCDPVEYIEGNAQHDGFIKMRAAMQAVDPSISVGAVGHESSLGGWGRGVLTRGGSVMDYYVIHTYPQYYNYGNPRREVEHIVSIPQYLWPKIKREADLAFDQYAAGRDIPIALNEFNIVPEWGKTDYRNYLNKHVNALFMADSIGMMIVNGYDMAAQWDVMNGPSPEMGGGVNEFGLMRAYDYDRNMTRQPKYYAFPIWARFGLTTVPVTSSVDPAKEMSVYAGRPAPGIVSILLINKSDRPADAQITLAGARQILGGTLDTVTADSPDAVISAFNGVTNPKDDLSDAPPVTLNGAPGNRFNHTVPPYSIALLRLRIR
ncbi:MAG: alpha-L-arabinofuranosidase, partial [Anaerolineae bacterium]|nr:hypothetical protein [Thermoflexales bacterium]MDW8408327.1 alpha-L-arabinofuranosidase [Anaerolineae bacterium]